MALPKWLDELASSGLIASFLTSEPLDVSAEDKQVSINKGIAYGIYVGSAGDVELVTPNGETVIYKNVSIGSHPFACTSIKNANTSAADIVVGAW
ncbi:MAG: hypothetical protein OQK32_03455 [Gammaproteobacteria bacterium]|nr:hypothetical protein [Gammaproteobacteria bacterium]MCW8924510.1 hypothetical protein [Gammaproteobacteria bacterium]